MTAIGHSDDQPQANAFASPRAQAGETGRRRALALTGLLVAAIVIGGGALRLACASGPMLNDEMLSIELIRGLPHIWDVLWRVSHDNNHFLNSLWLYVVNSPHVGPLLLRAPSILFGTALIAVMAAIGGRSSPTAAIVAGALTALSYFFFDYSIEARGYAALALAFAIAFDATERCLVNPGSRARAALAAASLFGTFSHFAMYPALVLIGLGGVAALWRRNRAFEPTAAAALRIFTPAALAALPALACIYAGVRVVGWFKIGAVLPFDAFLAVRALAIAVRTTFGVPQAVPAALVLAASAVLVVAAFASRAISADRKLLYAAVLIGLPAAVFAIRPFNAHVPRYYLIIPLTLIALVADLVGAWLRDGGARRVAAGLALGVVLCADAAQIARFQAYQAHPWTDAMAIIAASPHPLVVTDFEDRIGLFVRYYDRREGAHVRWVAATDICQTPPGWLLTWSTATEKIPVRTEMGASCPTSFVLVGRYATWGLSKVPWALYRRQ